MSVVGNENLATKPQKRLASPHKAFISVKKSKVNGMEGSTRSDGFDECDRDMKTSVMSLLNDIMTLVEKTMREFDGESSSTINGGDSRCEKAAEEFTSNGVVVPGAQMVTIDDDEVEVLECLKVSKTPSTTKREKAAHGSHKKVDDAMKKKKEMEKQRKAEERRIKLEQAAAAKELKKKEREALLEQKRIEKEREREEHRKLMEMKRKAEEEAKERKRKEEEEKREKKRKEEEEKRERKREEEERKEQKRKEEEERREQKRKEEEERRERKRKEEEAEELKKKRASDRFLSFFSKIERPTNPVLHPVEGPFRPFEIKEGMTIAPIMRRAPLSPNTHDQLLELPEGPSYLANLPRRAPCQRKPMRAKLFQFHDNYRPPYYGTWRKKSSVVSGRRPLAKDIQVDYEVDSDEEWEDDTEGDDCENDEPLEEENEADEKCSDDEDGFFVDPEYLSAGEGDDESDEDFPRVGCTEDPDERKGRLKAMAEEWKENVNKKSQKYKKLRPAFYGPVFGSAGCDPPPPFLLPVAFFNYES